MVSTSVKAADAGAFTLCALHLGVEAFRARPVSIPNGYGKFELVFKRGRELTGCIGFLCGYQTPYNAKGG